MSLGLMSDRLPMNGIPSSTISGSLLAFSERVPRIRICIEAPGAEDVCAMSTPATRFCKAYVTLVAGISRSLSPSTEAMEPVTSLRRALP